jgi:large conductance mechanosensitive channel
VGELALNYGNFLQSVIDFLIISLAIFLMLKWLALFQRKKEEEVALPPEPSKEEVLLTEIRDILRGTGLDTE